MATQPISLEFMLAKKMEKDKYVKRRDSPTKPRQERTSPTQTDLKNSEEITVEEYCEEVAKMALKEYVDTVQDSTCHQDRTKNHI